MKLWSVVLILLASCVAHADDLPDLSKTPGVVRPGMTKAIICTIKWGLDERRVTNAMRKEVFKRYGYTGYDDPKCSKDQHSHTCEIDHLISRELGGADTPDNLWPQSYGGQWNAHMKDKLENRLNRELCIGALTLKQARAMLTKDWREAYTKYYPNEGKPK